MRVCYAEGNVPLLCCVEIPAVFFTKGLDLFICTAEDISVKLLYIQLAQVIALQSGLYIEECETVLYACANGNHILM